MKPFPSMALAMLACLFPIGLIADSIPDPKISLQRGGGSTPIGLGSFAFNLDAQGGGIFPFCNNTPFLATPQMDCAHYGNGGESAGNNQGTDQSLEGITFYTINFTTEFPVGKTLFTCESDLFAFCAFTLNADGTVGVTFFGTGYFYSDGSASAEAPDLLTSFGSSQTLNYFPGIAPGSHFIADFYNDPTCVPTPDQPCAGSRDPGAPVTAQAGTPEPASWVLLATAGAALAGRKRWAAAGRRLARLAAKFL
jgi:hypothetical protein